VEQKTDILIVGGGPAGIVSAATAKKYYTDKNILLIKDIENGVIPCGIPYMIKSLNAPDENKLGTEALEKKGIEVVVDKAIKIDRNNKVIETKNNKRYCYEKLILAVGSAPILPSIAGSDKKGIYLIYKNMDYLKNAMAEIKKAKNVLIIGGGFIGIEFADELSEIEGLNVFLVELLPNLLANSFDSEFSKLAEEKLKSKGVKILTNTRVEEFCGNEKINKVKLSNNKELAIEAVILGIGAYPDTKLAQEAGLDIGRGKGIWADEYMRTVDPDIFAVGCLLQQLLLRQELPELIFIN